MSDTDMSGVEVNTAEAPPTHWRRLIYLAPALIFAIVAGYFLWGLDPDRDPSAIPSAMIDQPAPAFDLPAIEGMDGPGLKTADLKDGRVSLVNFFASWCVPCLAEHPLLMELSKYGDVRVFGVNYKNKPEKARPWLERLGNPYERIGADRGGRVAINWGVYGVPETFIVDGTGRIRYRHLGPMTPTALKETVLPIIAELRQ